VTTLDDLRARAEELGDTPEGRGLQVFIDLASDIPAGVAVMGKIQRSFVDAATREQIATATTFSEVQEAVGPEYEVTIEPA